MFTPEFIQATGITEGQVNELTTFVTDAKLTPEHVNALQSHIINMAADIRNNGANDHAQGIIAGAAKLITEKTGIKLNQGEKYADFLLRSGSEFFSKKEQALKQKETDLEEKIKNGDVSEVTKQKLADVQSKLEALQQKEASIDEIITGDYKNKYEQASKEIISFKEKTAFAMARPSFPKEANPYEVAAKLREAEDEIRASYDIEFDENNEAIAIDKTNKFKTAKLSDLILKNEKISTLMKGRQQDGANHKKFDQKLDGIPFSIPENPSSSDIQKAIKDYLQNELKLGFTSEEYAQKFGELNIKIRQQLQKTA